MIVVPLLAWGLHIIPADERAEYLKFNDGAVCVG
jgi:hypothetical protein